MKHIYYGCHEYFWIHLGSGVFRQTFRANVIQSSTRNDSRLSIIRAWSLKHLSFNVQLHLTQIALNRYKEHFTLISIKRDHFRSRVNKDSLRLSVWGYSALLADKLCDISRFAPWRHCHKKDYWDPNIWCTCKSHWSHPRAMLHSVVQSQPYGSIDVHSQSGRWK